MAANGIRMQWATGTSSHADQAGRTRTPRAPDVAPASSAYQCTAWASMPTATGQPIIRYGIEKKTG